MWQVIRSYAKVICSVNLGILTLGHWPALASEKARLENWVFVIDGRESEYQAKLVITMLNATTGKISGSLIDPAESTHELRPCSETELKNPAGLDPDKTTCSYILQFGDNIAYNLVTSGLVKENWRFVLRGGMTEILGSSGKIFSIPISPEEHVFFSGHLAPDVATKSGEGNLAAKSYFDRGNQFFDQENYAAALEQYSKAIELDPKYASAYFNRGLTYFNFGEYHRADFLKKGLTYLNLDEYHRAVYDYTQYLNLIPKDPEAWNIRGKAFYVLGQYQKALYDFNQSIKLNPSLQEAKSNRERVYLALKTPQQRVTEFYNSLLKKRSQKPQHSGFLTKELSNALDAEETNSTVVIWKIS